MMILRIAARNVLRNRRRSIMTVGTLAIGVVATLLIGALMKFIMLDFQTSTVRRNGHLAIFQKGYFDFGTGNPAEYGISEYQRLLSSVQQDPELSGLITVASPFQVVFGVAGNYDANLSKTFLGRGIIPADQARMRLWNDYHVDEGPPPEEPLKANDGGFIGLGIARILGLCEQLKLAQCPQRPVQPVVQQIKSAGNDLPVGVLDAAAQQRAAQLKDEGSSTKAKVELLAATTGGAPNVVTLNIEGVERQGIKELDDSYVLMQLPFSQQLVYGRDKPKVTGITLQLKHTADIPVVEEKLKKIFEREHFDLEMRDFQDMTPLYRQAMGFFAFLFGFVALIIGIIVLFTVVNTMTMCVMERTVEIGTLRALGTQRMTVRGQFLIEGALLGVIGATLGVILAAVIVLAINSSGMTWSPPTSSGRIPLKLYLFRDASLMVGMWLSVSAVAAIASVWPANRAARLQVVEALRHV